MIKKPQNPIQGEIFQCSVKVKNDLSEKTTIIRFLAEQVSHHPAGKTRSWLGLTVKW